MIESIRRRLAYLLHPDTYGTADLEADELNELIEQARQLEWAVYELEEKADLWENDAVIDVSREWDRLKQRLGLDLFERPPER